LLFQFSAFAFKTRDSKDLIFKDGDRVAFIGNSIMHGGLYHLYTPLPRICYPGVTDREFAIPAPENHSSISAKE